MCASARRCTQHRAARLRAWHCREHPLWAPPVHVLFAPSCAVVVSLIRPSGGEVDKRDVAFPIEVHLLEAGNQLHLRTEHATHGAISTRRMDRMCDARPPPARASPGAPAAPIHARTSSQSLSSRIITLM